MRIFMGPIIIKQTIITIMKKIYRFITGMFFLLLLQFSIAQSIYIYPLANGFSPIQAGGPDLIVIPNNSGLTGEFTNRAVPETTCGQGGTASGYFFEDDAGLQFNNPAGFIGQSYSLAMNFQIDEFISPPPWVRLLSFTHVDDIGVYIYLTNPPTNGTLEFWPYGTVGENNFFNTSDFYQMVLVRNENGLIKIYINGQEFAEYDDSSTQKFVPGPPDNFIVFFRDHPSVLANEASPGFVSNIIIRNLSWTPEEVQTIWDNFCSSLLDIEEPVIPGLRIYPNPVTSGVMNIEASFTMADAGFRIYDVSGRMVMAGHLNSGNNPIDIRGLKAGLYLVMVVENEREIRTERVVKY